VTGPTRRLYGFELEPEVRGWLDSLSDSNYKRADETSGVRTALGLSVAELAMRAALTDDDIERIEEGGTEPTIPLLRRLAQALDADVRLTAGHDLGSVWFETHAA
jgi:DNA-binding XRE family transcriptional regulator